MPDKSLIWLGSTRRDVRGFSAAARRLTGFQLRRVQQGLDPADWKPMSTIGPGVREVRIQIAGAHRVFYLATHPEAIYVLHAFEKKEDTQDRRPRPAARERAISGIGRVEAATWQNRAQLE